MQAVAGYLRGLREGRGLSQVQVAASVGTMLGRDVQSTTIWRIETAKTVPGGDMLLALLNTLRGDMDELLRLLCKCKDPTVWAVRVRSACGPGGGVCCITSGSRP